MICREGAAALLLILFLGSGPTAWAQDASSGGLEVHGFGEWAYGDTDGNRYLVGSDDGRYQNASLSLNLAYRSGDRLTIVGQIQAEQNPIVETNDVEVSLDYAFLEWKVAEYLKLRAGRAKHPFGLYAEIFDVGTVRPFFLLPQGIYGPQGFTAQFYDGLGVTGSTHGDSWGLDYDGYVGQIQGELRFPGPLSGDPTEVLESIVDTGFTIRDVIGGRLTLLTPASGLSFGISAYRGDEVFEITDPTNPEAGAEFDRDTYLAHAEYLTDRWSIRTEAGSYDSGGRFEQDGAYFEAAYRIGEHWQLAGRWDSWEASIPGIDTSNFPQFFRQILEHEELAFGINYWLAPNAVFKLSYHTVEGNRFAFPGEQAAVAQAIFTNSLDDETKMLVFGVQFSF